MALPQTALRLAVPLSEVLQRGFGTLPVKLIHNLPKRSVKPGLVELTHYLPQLAAKAASAPRPLEDFLKCSRADERRVRRVAWRLKEVMRLGRRPIEDYVKTLAARVNLPAPIVKSAVELLERNRRVLFGKNPWVSATTALWLASLKRLGLLKALAEAAGTTTASIRNAANRMRI